MIFKSKEVAGRSSTAFQPISGCLVALAVRKCCFDTRRGFYKGEALLGMIRYRVGILLWFCISGESMWVMFVLNKSQETLRAMVDFGGSNFE